MIPTVFIVGAPRCGTSSLYHLLDAHPQVFMSRPKEPHHFGADLEIRPRLHASREAYLALFEGAGDVRHAGEASVLYLYSRTAPAEILALSPDARIIVMLRDPVEFVPSLHAHNLLLTYEDVRDLAEAIALEPERRAGRRIPPGCVAPLALQYTSLARYADHVRRYQEAFGRDRVLCLLLEDLHDRPEEVRDRTFSFLGLDRTGLPSLGRHNPRQRWRHQRLGRALLSAYRHAAGLGSRLPTRLLRTSALVAVAGLFYLPLKLGVSAAPTTTLPRDLRRKLQDQLRDDVERLGELIGRDLSAWSRSDA